MWCVFFRENKRWLGFVIIINSAGFIWISFYVKIIILWVFWLYNFILKLFGRGFISFVWHICKSIYERQSDDHIWFDFEEKNSSGHKFLLEKHKLNLEFKMSSIHILNKCIPQQLPTKCCDLWEMFYKPQFMCISIVLDQTLFIGVNWRVFSMVFVDKPGSGRIRSLVLLYLGSAHFFTGSIGFEVWAVLFRGFK